MFSAFPASVFFTQPPDPPEPPRLVPPPDLERLIPVSTPPPLEALVRALFMLSPPIHLYFSRHYIMLIITNQFLVVLPLSFTSDGWTVCACSVFIRTLPCHLTLTLRRTPACYGNRREPEVFRNFHAQPTP